MLPPRLDDQRAALRLALCDDIGQAAYDGEAVALAFLRLLALLEPLPAAGVAAGLLERRYGVAWPGADDLAAVGSVCGAAVPGEILREEAAHDAPVHSESVRGISVPDEAMGGQELAASLWLQTAAVRHTSGDTGRMAQRLLDDFRRGVLGAIALELP